MVDNKRTRAITFKLPASDYFLLTEYMDRTSITLSQFLEEIVDYYLLLKRELTIPSGDIVEEITGELEILLTNEERLSRLIKKNPESIKLMDLQSVGFPTLTWKLEEILKKKRVGYKPISYVPLMERKYIVSVRVDKEHLEFWDDYCEKHFIPRTSLFRKAIYNFFYPNGIEFTINNREFLKNIIFNLIVGAGTIEYSELRFIFKNTPPEILVSILDELEMSGFIGQKGHERRVYVPTFVSSQEMNREIFFADLLSRIF